jgi:hypothetical protein
MLCHTLLEGPDRCERQLLELRYDFVDEHLRQWNNADKWERLFQWYQFHGMHKRAAEVMYEQAVVDWGDAQFSQFGSLQRPTIEGRIRCLKLAAAAAAEVCSSANYTHPGAGGGHAGSAAALEAKRRYEETLILAEIQRDALQLLRSQAQMQAQILQSHAHAQAQSQAHSHAIEQQQMQLDWALNTLKDNLVLRDQWTREEPIGSAGGGAGAGAGAGVTSMSLLRVVYNLGVLSFASANTAHACCGLWGLVLRLLKVLRASDVETVERTWGCIIFR